MLQTVVDFSENQQLISKNFEKCEDKLFKIFGEVF